jgi:ABC-type molybdate transport system permease subunit
MVSTATQTETFKRSLGLGEAKQEVNWVSRGFMTTDYTKAQKRSAKRAEQPRQSMLDSAAQADEACRLVLSLDPKPLLKGRNARTKAVLAWLAIFTDRGYLNSLLGMFGASPVSWLSYENPAMLFLCVVIAEIWRATSIVLVILVAGVQLIPKEYNEAAEVFGAGPWTRFRRITLPLIKPSLQTALILRTVMAFEVFAVVYALSGRDFPVLVGEAYNWQGPFQNTHVASAYALLILLISMACTLFYLRALRVRRETLA